IRKGSAHNPCVAKFEYADAISSVDTSEVPRTSDGTGVRGDRIPILWATSTIFSAPTSSCSATCAKTVLSDADVASARVTKPLRPAPPTVHLFPCSEQGKPQSKVCGLEALN